MGTHRRPLRMLCSGIRALCMQLTLPMELGMVPITQGRPVERYKECLRSLRKWLRKNMALMRTLTFSWNMLRIRKIGAGADGHSMVQTHLGFPVGNAANMVTPKKNPTTFSASQRRSGIHWLMEGQRVKAHLKKL